MYGGVQYSIGQRELADVQEEIAAAITSGGPHWLDVNFGEGAPRHARLLITQGVELSLIPIDPDAEPEPYSGGGSDVSLPGTEPI